MSLSPSSLFYICQPALGLDTILEVHFNIPQ